MIERVSTLPIADLCPLVAEAVASGDRFMARLVEEYERGTNRFDRAGEALFVARQGEGLVGVCGLNVDPYVGDARVGRVRHLYVSKAARRLGVGRALVEAVVEAATGGFEVLTLRTENPDAARLYRALGFSEAPRYAEATHWRSLGGTSGRP